MPVHKLLGLFAAGWMLITIGVDPAFAASPPAQNLFAQDPSQLDIDEDSGSFACLKSAGSGCGGCVDALSCQSIMPLPPSAAPLLSAIWRSRHWPYQAWAGRTLSPDPGPPRS